MREELIKLFDEMEAAQRHYQAAPSESNLKDIRKAEKRFFEFCKEIKPLPLTKKEVYAERRRRDAFMDKMFSKLMKTSKPKAKREPNASRNRGKCVEAPRTRFP